MVAWEIQRRWEVVLVLEASVFQNQGKGPKVDESMNSHDVREFSMWIRRSQWVVQLGWREGVIKNHKQKVMMETQYTGHFLGAWEGWEGLLGDGEPLSASEQVGSLVGKGLQVRLWAERLMGGLPVT